MRVFNKYTKEELLFPNNPQLIIRQFYSPYYFAFDIISETLNNIINKYKDVPLTEHKITRAEQTMLGRDASYADFIPNWEVDGYDKVAGSDTTANQIKAEFIRRYNEDDPAIIRFINRTNECFVVRAGTPSDKAIPYRAGYRYDKEKHRVRGKRQTAKSLTES